MKTMHLLILLLSAAGPAAARFELVREAVQTT